MITLYEFSVNLHVASEARSTDVESRLVKTEGTNNQFEVAIEVIEFSPKDDNLFTADKTHTHSEEFSADSCEEAMDTFTGLLNTIAMPLLAWSDSESLSKITETKPDGEITSQS